MDLQRASWGRLTQWQLLAEMPLGVGNPVLIAQTVQRQIQFPLCP